MGRYIYDSVNQQEIPIYGAGGHTIKNSSGTSMAQRASLQFMNATVTDDSTNDVTIVTPEGGDSGIMIAGTEETSTASQAYLPEQFLIYDGVLYKVIESITIGDTLEEDENIEAVTLGGELTNHLSVNGTGFYFDSHDGQFGYNTSPNRGADTFVPFSSGGASLVGTYSANTTVDVSAFGAEDASEFVATCPSNAYQSGTAWYIQHGTASGYCADSATYTAPTLSLSNGILTVNVGKITANYTVRGSAGSKTANLSTNVYYIGDIS